MEQPIINAFMSMGVVVLALVGILLFMKKISKKRQASSGNLNIEVLAKTAITQKSQLLVVKVDNRTLLIGSGDGNVSLISDLSESAEQPSALRRVPRENVHKYQLPTSVENIARYRREQKLNAETSRPQTSQPKLSEADIRKSLSFGSFIKSAFKRA